MDSSNDKFKDECGVFGVYSNKPYRCCINDLLWTYMHFNIEDKKVQE